MDVIRTAAVMRKVRREISGSVGLVATLGGIHAGHAKHMDSVRPLCDVLVGSIFLNPTQFGANEDLSNYPSDETEDIAKFEHHGTDIVFVPSVREMYPPEGISEVDPGPVADVLEGAERPGHFVGVATVVNRLFSIIDPDKATFGEKDAQQLRIVRHIVASLALDIEIIPIPTVREPDGLAVSSRNAYLSSTERKAGTVLYRALKSVRKAEVSGERNGDTLRSIMLKMLAKEPLVKTHYVSIADADTFEELVEIKGSARALLAATIGDARLIDNLLLS